MFRFMKPFLLLSVLMYSTSAFAGPWAQLPDAIAQLQVDSSNREAEAVIRSAEASIRAEATRGHLAAVATLMEVYSSLVMRLPDGDRRLFAAEHLVAAELVSFGQKQRDEDLFSAAGAWALAAGYDRSGSSVDLLREVLVPPADPEVGAEWLAPLDGATLVYVAPGRVRIGCSENDRRCRKNEVFFRWIETPGFWIEKDEVTNARYRLCVKFGGCSPPKDGFRFSEEGHQTEPVVGLSWRQARDFTVWAGRKLPTEAVWERSARLQNESWRFPWGNNRNLGLANVWNESAASGRGPVAVGSFPPTEEGLFDLAGNVWEWCSDRYQLGLKQLPGDGSPLRSGSGRVARGGSWRRSIDMARISTRTWFDETYSADDVGFRCVSPGSSEISDAAVMATATRTFGVEVEPGRELVGATLSPEDRRYIDRRSITWLVLEERTGAAVLQAALLLQREPRDTVALDLLDRVEEEIAAAVRAGDLRESTLIWDGYAKAAEAIPRYERRRRQVEAAAVAVLRSCGDDSVRKGDFDLARSCYEAWHAIAPNDTSIPKALASLEPESGSIRTTPEDFREMVWVPGGSFRLGFSEGDRLPPADELPASTIFVKGFWLDRNEVTNADYRRCVNDGACTPPSQTEAFDDPNRSRHPVLWVDWFQARNFAEWSGKRLPTEIEWERAARAGSSTRFPWGDRWDSSLGNGLGMTAEDYWGAESPVASFPPNVWGIYDLIGNASEWVQDVYHSSYRGVPRDGRPWEQETGPSAERQRVARGGFFGEPGPRQRVSRRNARRPTEPHRGTGFRCAAD